jgi:Flp pilus assembly pilin Flp
MPITKESVFETLHVDQEGIDRVFEKVKELIREGNVRRLLVKNHEGVTLIEVPLTVGVVGAVLVPVWAAIAAIAAIVSDATIIVEKRDAPEQER